MKQQLIIFFCLFGWLGICRAGLFEQGFSIEYQVEHNGIRLGTNTQTLHKLNDSTWEYKGEAIPKGFAAMFLSDELYESTTFTLYNDTIRPLHYFYLHKKSRNREKRLELTFDWDKKIAQSSHENRILNLADNTQDLMSFQLYLMRYLQKLEPPLTISLATRKEVADFLMQSRGEETIEIPAGKFVTIKLESRDVDGDRYILWFARMLDYLPVKIEKIDKDKDRTTFQMESFKKNSP